MAYIDISYYSGIFNPSSDCSDFDRLADIASDIIDSLCTVSPTDKDIQDERFLKAVAYQVELLEAQGGVNAILGFSEASQAGGSESLGDYSVSHTPGSQQTVTTKGGIPVSPLTLSLLSKMGLRSRWAFADHYRRR